MKKILLIILISIVGLINLYSQKEETDTLVYQTITDFKLDTVAFIRYNFEDRAEAYVGESFGKLMADLNIRPMIMGIGYSLGEEGERLFSGIRLYIQSNNGGRCYIHISWQDPQIMPLEAERLLRKNGMYKWIDDYISIFGEYKIRRVVANTPSE
ncbi:hypothetical protein [Dysgonomonas massiliensis]|uniref:hypothetical protein n=1 Tax=Dysgonomonas massiliensis TaxID=2040292 RepID=UPI000C77C5BA|nr:hypothetical protein [Dysgonomonas massiliensis]